MSKRKGLEFPPHVIEEAFRRNWEGSKGGGYWCEWCWFTNAKRQYFQVDHLLPAVIKGNPNPDCTPTIDNACILCTACNQSKNNFGFPRHGVGLAYRSPNLNMAPEGRRVPALSWDDLVLMAQRKGPFRRQD